MCKIEFEKKYPNFLEVTNSSKLYSQTSLKSK